MTLLALSGALLFWSIGTWSMVPALLLHGFIMAFLFAPVHECSHGTPFRSRGLNETVYWIFCLIYMVPPTMFRYSHAIHHSYTQVRGGDPDMMPERMTVGYYLYYLTAFRFWTRVIRWHLTLPFGLISADERHYLPDSEKPRLKWEGRVIWLIYGSIAALAIYSGSWLPVTLWILPRLLGEPFMRWVRIAEHGECAEGGNLTRNTRTTRAPGWFKVLFWNMSYHAEHHLSPMVPFRALPRFHEKVKDRLYPVGSGYFAIHREILGKISRRRGVTWERHGGEAHAAQ